MRYYSEIHAGLGKDRDMEVVVEQPLFCSRAEVSHHFPEEELSLLLAFPLKEKYHVKNTNMIFSKELLGLIPESLLCELATIALDYHIRTALRALHKGDENIREAAIKAAEAGETSAKAMHYALLASDLRPKTRIF